MNKIISLICVLLIFGCASTQSNIKINSVDTFNLDNYSDFYININDSFLSAEIDPIELEKFSNNFKNALEEKGLSYDKNSNLTFEINITTKDKIDADRGSLGYYYYSPYYYNRYSFNNDVRTVTENILRINLKDKELDTTVWTVLTVWRNGSSRDVTTDDGSNILIDEIMLSFL
jgi:hypothetical protein